MEQGLGRVKSLPLDLSSLSPSKILSLSISRRVSSKPLSLATGWWFLSLLFHTRIADTGSWFVLQLLLSYITKTECVDPVVILIKKVPH